MLISFKRKSPHPPYYLTRCLHSWCHLSCSIQCLKPGILAVHTCRCALSKCYSAALPVLELEVDDVDPKKTAMTAKDYLLFGYYGGLVHTGQSPTRLPPVAQFYWGWPACWQTERLKHVSLLCASQGWRITARLWACSCTHWLLPQWSSMQSRWQPTRSLC